MMMISIYCKKFTRIIPLFASSIHSVKSIDNVNDNTIHNYNIFTDIISDKPSTNEIDNLISFITNSKHLIALTGAGISTPSGIPDYRGPYGSYKKGHQPILSHEYSRSELMRKRYWLRSYLSWKERFASVRPNSAHYSLSLLENHNYIKLIITQNVDNLHNLSGSSNVIDLHGRIDLVRCMNCNTISPREQLQSVFEELNSDFLSNIITNNNQNNNLRADGDIELNIDNYNEFIVPDCEKCGGVIKPNVVMFGDSVNRIIVNHINSEVDKCDGLLIIGTSLEVFSAYRFVKRCVDRNVPIAIINYGETRVERNESAYIVYKSSTNCANLLTEVVNKLML